MFFETCNSLISIRKDDELSWQVLIIGIELEKKLLKPGIILMTMEDTLFYKQELFFQAAPKQEKLPSGNMNKHYTSLK